MIRRTVPVIQSIDRVIQRKMKCAPPQSHFESILDKYIVFFLIPPKKKQLMKNEVKKLFTPQKKDSPSYENESFCNDD